ncbi:MAG: SDR family oxidoreductase [Leptospirales bacterium]|nr:SDR family oxidoreductase [Leptospirales bacterium]
MEKALVTGATGLIGFNIVRQLLDAGVPVAALVRSPERARTMLPAACELIKGDVTDAASLAAAVRGCQIVYHAAGFPEQWMKDPGIFTEVNVGGTRNMLEASRQAGVRRFVYTSTIDVFRAGPGERYDETELDPKPKGTYYERSKQEADQLAVDFLQKGMDIVFLHPSGLYGPGPSTSPGLNLLIIDLKKGKIPMLLPGGFPVVFSEDVARGHLLAANKAKAGDRFILSENYFDLADVARIVCDQLGIKKVPRVMPLWMGKTISIAGEALSSITGRPPLIPRGQLHFMQWRAIPVSTHAQQALGWKPLEFKEGIRQTIAYLQSTGALPR